MSEPCQENNQYYLSKMPKGWFYAKFRDSIEKISLTNKKLKNSEYIENGTIPVVDQGHSLIGGYTNRHELTINRKSPIIIFGDHTKVIKFIDFNFVAGAEGVKAFYVKSWYNPKFLYHLLHNLNLPDKGYARHFQYLEKENLVLPPLNEQHRIVAKIEELFTQLDAGIASMKKAQAQLKRYRQAVLKAAFEGRLTQEWREEHNGEIEPAETLQKKVEMINEKSNERLLKQGDFLKSPNILDFPPNWILVRIGDVVEVLDHKRIPVNKADRAQRRGIIPYYGANGRVDWINDFLFDEPLVLVVEDETFVGREIPFSYKITGKSWVNNHAHVLKPKNILNIDFLNYSLMFYPFTQFTSGITGRRKLTKFALINAPYKLPAYKEQLRIVSEIERHFYQIDHLESIIEINLHQANTLRQSILKQAFEGKLVPQDPNDEPASVLLERIKAEKEQHQTTKKTTRIPRKKKVTSHVN